MRSTLLALPVRKEAYFQELWKRKKLSTGIAGELDRFDEIATKLVCTALDKEIYCLLCLPDTRMKRGASIVATLLIKYAIEAISKKSSKKRILFCGTSAKFKYAIESTTVGTLNLSEAFSYFQLSGKRSSTGLSSPINSDSLPELSCVYNPSDPAEIINQYNPKIVIIDSGANVEIEWLNPLLDACRKKNIAVVGWTTNPFSSACDSFEQHNGSLFFFPKSDFADSNKTLTEFYLTNRAYHASVLQLDGDQVQAINNDFLLAKYILRPLSKQTGESIVKKNALGLCWTYIKNMESLTVPLTLYNQEAKKKWGTRSLKEYPEAIEKYITVLSRQDGGFKTALSSFLSQCEVLNQKISVLSPYWACLLNLCIEKDVSCDVKYWLFPGKAQKQIFSHALLSEINLREDELMNDCNIKLATFKEFANQEANDISENNWTRIKCLVIGLPNNYNKDLFTKILKFDPFILLYSNQLPLFKNIITKYNGLEKERLKKTVKSLKRISGNSDEGHVPAIVEPYGLNPKIQYLTITSTDSFKLSEPSIGNFTSLTSLQSELEMLFAPHTVYNEDKETHAFDPHEDNQRLSGLMVDKALCISFEQGYTLCVAEDERVNVLRSDGVASIFVRGVRTGDRLMVVHNSSRQNLFDLILSRVHDHPSLDVHMAMLRKWREEFHAGYLIWKHKSSDHDLSVFLQLLQDRGSAITSTLTISFWLDGTTLRPHDPLDIKRVGNVLGIKFIEENYFLIHDAASRIIGIHITLSRKLNTWLNRGLTRINQEDLELVDETIGLTIGELRSSIKILTVTGITSLNSPLLVSDLGKLQKNTSYDS